MTLSRFSLFLTTLTNSLWPVYKYELRKFVPMSLLIFCILFNQNILRILKDSIIIPEVSAEVTSFIKVYCVTPAAALFVVVYAQMVNNLSFEKIYYYLTTAFLSFFIIFAFFIYPKVSTLHMDLTKIDELMLAYPHLKWYIALTGNWSYIVFYVLSELWPNIFYILLFWQFANEITTTEQAKRFYMLFSLFGNSSLIVVGIVMMHLASEHSIIQKYFLEVENNVLFIQSSVVLVLVSSICSIFLVRFVCQNVMLDPQLYYKVKQERSTKQKMRLKESFQYVFSSKYLWLILICTAAFGFSMNLVEAVWKAQVKEIYSTTNKYAEFNSFYILWTGISIILMTIIGNSILRHHSWFITAVITPVTIMITGTIFFTLIVFDKNIFSFISSTTFMTPITMAVMIGTIQNIIAKGTKYSIWDTSREMLYIPLDNELRTKGKAAVDVVSAKVGKSSSGLIQSLLFTIFPAATYTSISLALMLIFIAVCLVWICAVKRIYYEYKKIA